MRKQIVHAPLATWFIPVERPDGSPFKVREFIPHALFGFFNDFGQNRTMPISICEQD